MTNRSMKHCRMMAHVQECGDERTFHVDTLFLAKRGTKILYFGSEASLHVLCGLGLVSSILRVGV